jgi:hypothetical protein
MVGPPQTIVYRSHWLILLHSQLCVSHNGSSFAYKEISLLTTLVGRPPT